MCVCAGCEKIKRGCFLLLRRRNFPCCARCVLCALWMLCVCALRPGPTPTVDTQFSVLFSLVCCRWIKHFHGLWADSERASERAASNLRIKCVLHTSHTAPGNATYAWCVFKVCVYAMHNGHQRQYTCGYATDCVCVCECSFVHVWCMHVHAFCLPPKCGIVKTLFIAVYRSLTLIV